MESEHFLPFFVVMVISVSSPSKTFPQAFAVILLGKRTQYMYLVLLDFQLSSTWPQV